MKRLRKSETFFHSMKSFSFIFHQYFITFLTLWEKKEQDRGKFNTQLKARIVKKSFVNFQDTQVDEIETIQSERRRTMIMEDN